MLTTLAQFRPDFHPRTVLALSRRLGRNGEPSWYRIAVPGRPNGRTGWIPAAAVELAPVDRWLVIYRGARKFELYVGGKLRRTGPVAVGARGMETPIGLFYVQSAVRPDAVSDPRRLRVRDERLLEALRLARAAASSASTARTRRG